MTVQEFAQAIRYSYDYSKKPGQLSLIADWAQTIPEDRLKEIWNRLTGEFSTEYNQVPDLARLKAMYKRMREEFVFRKSADPNARRIEYNKRAHREDVVDCFAKLREELNMPAYREK